MATATRGQRAALHSKPSRQRPQHCVTLRYPFDPRTATGSHQQGESLHTLLTGGEIEAGSCSPSAPRCPAPFPGLAGSAVRRPESGPAPSLWCRGSGLLYLESARSDVSLVPQITSSQGHFRRSLTSRSPAGAPRAGTGQPSCQSLCRLPRSALVTPRRCTSRLGGWGGSYALSQSADGCAGPGAWVGGAGVPLS